MNNITVKLLGDKDFLAKVLPMTPEDALKAFNEKGSDITLDELNEIGDAIKKVQANGGELSAEDLDKVAGGSKFGEFVTGFVIGAGAYYACAVFLW